MANKITHLCFCGFITHEVQIYSEQILSHVGQSDGTQT